LVESTWGVVCFHPFINLLLNHGIRGLQGIYFFASAQVASVGCMCSVIVHFLHCICVCDCDGRHESLIVLSCSMMVRGSHLLVRFYLGTMCMCTTPCIALGAVARLRGLSHPASTNSLPRLNYHAPQVAREPG
jgi:hypothetical protein